MKLTNFARQLRAVPMLTLWICAALFLHLVLGQGVFVAPRVAAPQTASLDQSAYSIRVASDLVLIPVTVVDQHDRFITGLEKDHFRLYEDDTEQAISQFSVDDAPISVGFVFDTSESMAGKQRKSREAVATFLKTANPDDEFFLVQFNSYVRLVVGMTQDTEELQREVMSTRPEGATALLDAVYFSLREMRNAHHTRKALIIVSDGGDNNSRHTLTEVQNALRESDVQMYGIGIFEPLEVRSRSIEEFGGPALLGHLTDETGRLFEVHDAQQLPGVASKIGLALRSQYVLGYKPSDDKHDGRYHHVQVVLALPDGFPKTHAFWRRGYYAPKD